MCVVCHLEQKVLKSHFKRSLRLLENGFGGGDKSGYSDLRRMLQ